MYLPFQAVHAPLEVPPSYVEPYEGVIKNDAGKIHAGVIIFQQ